MYRDFEEITDYIWNRFGSRSEQANNQLKEQIEYNTMAWKTNKSITEQEEFDKKRAEIKNRAKEIRDEREKQEKRREEIEEAEKEKRRQTESAHSAETD